MTRNEYFSQVTKHILEYDTGDFLLLSDLFDAVGLLKDLYLEEEVACSLIESLSALIHDEMRSAGQPEFLSRLSEGVDLLQSLEPEAATEVKAGILARMGAYLTQAGQTEKASPEDRKQDDETLQIFLSDAADRLVQAQSLILELENDLNNLEVVQHLFRIFHTIKGECGFLKIATLGELTHNIESLLDSLRNRTVEPSAEHVELLLEGLDMARKIVEKLQAGDFVVFSDVPLDSYLQKLGSVGDKSKSTLGDILVQEGKLKETDVVRILQKQKESAYTKKFGEIAVKENYLSAQELQETLGKQKKEATAGREARTDRTDPIIKVRASKVNFLVDMIGELLIAMGQVTEATPAMAQMRKIVRSLQYGAMELRTETVQSLFSNIKRVVRDLSKQLGKPVRLETKGEDLEIDRNLIEKLEEPLIHLVRNSLDHGLESPEDRKRAGKDPQGTISLEADRRGNSIVISVGDDGGGLNRERILAKAVERGLVKAESAESLSDAQVHNLIFASGFSTQENVSQISGRGVGMDIVRSVVTDNRGRVEIDTQAGRYTRFNLVFPLSTAIIDGMITRVGDNLFIFPIGSVVESMKVLPDQISTVNGRVEVVDLRGEAILVLRMHDIFEMTPPAEGALLIGMVVENSDKRKFMLLVDEVIAKREVVIKSLGNKFKNMKGITSGTVLGGGKIGLVLDVDQIVDLSLLEEVK